MDAILPFYHCKEAATTVTPTGVQQCEVKPQSVRNTGLEESRAAHTVDVKQMLSPKGFIEPFPRGAQHCTQQLTKHTSIPITPVLKHLTGCKVGKTPLSPFFFVTPCSLSAGRALLPPITIEMLNKYLARNTHHMSVQAGVGTWTSLDNHVSGTLA